ncbi:hypothetical protein SASPL_120971 [Salvia splendens]|uniref:Uncharacterized protein n=1 Tax=Salvia splendens TaxID=180675 RepID=A0A4D8Y3T3_SALSN|nr:uncharacterized protein At5g01610-like [Salvia splendens]XP_042068336.1 uncharacterized protein At5g01610-like [Salvia splendens]KAG6384586.1 hypothetical protein SASPL_155588 [Salvia splendens]KAG6418766.1 hypothetical protein SASPL_120971 [Salvia splendens]
MYTTAARLFLILSLLSAAAAAANPPSVYEVLQSYGFPAGLLPQGVTSYELDTTTGKFSVSLGGSCSFSISGYDLKYKSTITGTIANNKITDLNGIQVKILFFWINIIEVTSDGDELQLSVGIASANFPVDNFFECPQCGCGFDCVTRKARALPLVQYD